MSKSQKPNAGTSHEFDKVTRLAQGRGHTHIDRITVTGPLRHLPLGKRLYLESTDSLGMTDLVPAGSQAHRPRANRRRQVDDIFAQSKMVGADGYAEQLAFDCCPPQELQEHNLFGHKDLKGYVYEIFCRQLKRHRLTATPEEHDWWRTGSYVTLSLLHITGNHWCEPSHKALIIESIDQNNPRGKKRDCDTSITLGFTPKGTRSEHRMLTIYDKFEVLKDVWKSPGPLQQQLLRISEHSLRAEAKLFDEWLRTYGVDPTTGKIHNYKEALRRNPELAVRLRPLQYVSNWQFVDLDALFYQVLKSFPVLNSIQPVLTPDEKRELSRPALRVYTLWMKGENLSDHYSKSTISKYAAEVWAKVGVDIMARRRPERLPPVHVADIFCPGQLVAVPEFLINTPYYWKPRQG